MPEAAINKKSQPITWKGKVRFTWKRELAPPAAYTMLSENASNAKLCIAITFGAYR
jgi:hypothetical protein